MAQHIEMLYGFTWSGVLILQLEASRVWATVFERLCPGNTSARPPPGMASGVSSQPCGLAIALEQSLILITVGV